MNETTENNVVGEYEHGWVFLINIMETKLCLIVSKTVFFRILCTLADEILPKRKKQINDVFLLNETLSMKEVRKH